MANIWLEMFSSGSGDQTGCGIMQLIDYFDHGWRHNPDATCFIDGHGGKSWSYAETADVSHRVAASLRAAGVRRGSRVAVLSSNDPRAFMCQLGILRSGAAYVPLNMKSSDGDLAALLRLTACDMLFYEGALADRVAVLNGDLTSIRDFVAIGSGRPDDPELSNWMAAPGTRVALPEEDGEAPAWIMGTGGTTGLPKAVVMPQRAMAGQTLALIAHLPEEKPVQAVMAPLTHAAGALTYPVFCQGGTTIVYREFDPETLIASIERHKVTRFFLPPTAIYALLAHPGVRGHDYASLRYILYGAAPMSADKLKEAMQVFGPVMAQFYGQAEAPTICAFMSPRDHIEAASDPAREGRLASCGRASVIANVAILDEDGTEAPTGTVGEICVRTPLRMIGYLDDPEKTAEVDRGHGWQGTGDLGRMDDDGYIYIVDRTRDMIISGGFNVYPSEVERILWAHPAVGDCAVVGVPDDYWGEAVTAFVEVKPGAQVSSEELIALCRAELGPVKAPKAVHFRALPRSPVGKVLKRAIRDEYWKGRSRAV